MKKSELFESAVKQEFTLDEFVSTVISGLFAALVVAAAVMSLVGCTPY